MQFIRNIFSKLKLKDMIFVNEVSYKGKSVSIINGKVFIDGEAIDSDSKQITIRVEGNLEKLDADYCEKIDVAGSVGSLNATAGDIICGDVTNGVETISGNINCKSIKGNVETTSGDIECDGNITGNVETTSGDVECVNVGGKIDTLSGNIRHNK